MNRELGSVIRGTESFVQVSRMFPDDAAAEAWFTKTRWPNGVHCTACGSVNVQERKTRKPQPYRCRDCRKDFSVKTGTLMHSSPMGLQTWAIAIYLLATNLKSVSSMKLHSDLEITQKNAWFLAKRIRETWCDNAAPFAGPVEVDETYFGGKKKNMPKAKREKIKGRGTAGKAIVAGVKDRATNQVSARTVAGTDVRTLQGFVAEHAAPGAKVFTDDAAAYRGMPFDHEAVRHSVGEYVNGMAHTNGIESFWSMLKRAHKGTFHKISAKHLDRYVTEFAGRHNNRPTDTLDQMAEIARAMAGERLMYRYLDRRQRVGEPHVTNTTDDCGTRHVDEPDGP